MAMRDKIKAMLAMKGQNQNDLAELLGITYQALSLKINGHSDFKSRELIRILNAYDLEPKELVNIFLTLDN